MGQILSIPLIFMGLWVLLRAGKWPNNPFGFAPRDLEERAAAERAEKMVKSK
jgi:prolipoprotein diacylglyceryltransferase